MCFCARIVALPYRRLWRLAVLPSLHPSAAALSHCFRKISFTNSHI